MSLPPELLRTVTREEINQLAVRRYEGRIHVVEGKDDLPAATEDLLRESVVGFDTETRPAFRPGESYLPSLAQLATARAVWLFRLPGKENELALAEVLSSIHVTKAGVGTADDLKSLKKSIAFQEQAVVDLGKVAHKHGLKQSGVRNLAGLFLGFRIPKGAKTTNWSRRQLSPQQVAYAATDAWACRELHVRFQELGIL